MSFQFNIQNRRVEERLFAVLVVGLLLIISLIGSGMYRYSNEDVANGPVAYRMTGGTWSVVYFSVNANKPVDVCITDETGLEMMKSGGGALCLFKASNVKSIDKFWRFPENGPLYLVVIPLQGENGVKVRVRISTMFSNW